MLSKKKPPHDEPSPTLSDNVPFNIDEVITWLVVDWRMKSLEIVSYLSYRVCLRIIFGVGADASVFIRFISWGVCPLQATVVKNQYKPVWGGVNCVLEAVLNPSPLLIGKVLYTKGLAASEDKVVVTKNAYKAGAMYIDNKKYSQNKIIVIIVLIITNNNNNNSLCLVS